MGMNLFEYRDNDALNKPEIKSALVYAVKVCETAR